MLAAGALLVFPLGCGSGEETGTTTPIPLEPTEIDLTLDGYSSPSTAGILLAEERSYFDELGVDLWVRTPQSRLRPLRYVVEGEVAMAVAHMPQVVLAGEKGAPVIAFASLVTEPTASMIWLRGSKISDLADLKGKTIAITGLPFERDFLEAALAGAGLTLDDVKVERADYELVQALASGRADAIFGSSVVEGAELEARGLRPEFTSAADLGLPDYEELVLIARRDRLEKEPEVIERFMAALSRGTAVAIKDPAAATQAIAGSIGADSDVTLKSTEAGVEKTVPLLSANGHLDPGKAEGLMEWMREEGMIRRKIPVSALLTNDYLSQSGQ